MCRNASMSKLPAETLAKLENKNETAKTLQNSLLTPEYRAEHFLNHVFASGDTWFGKFCQRNL